MNTNELPEGLEHESTKSFSIVEIERDHEMQMDENDLNEASSVDLVHLLDAEKDYYDNESQLDETSSLDACWIFNSEDGYGNDGDLKSDLYVDEIESNFEDEINNKLLKDVCDLDNEIDSDTE